ncbi:MAG TPA: hypothetical protein VLG71_00280 [Candidatus Limnocylindria bacterium]|nr:hypothetical protein [Candidatus Limnocylindria bacterium]
MNRFLYIPYLSLLLLCTPQISQAAAQTIPMSRMAWLREHVPVAPNRTLRLLDKSYKLQNRASTVCPQTLEHYQEQIRDVKTVLFAHHKDLFVRLTYQNNAQQKRLRDLTNLLMCHIMNIDEILGTKPRSIIDLDPTHT